MQQSRDNCNLTWRDEIEGANRSDAGGQSGGETGVGRLMTEWRQLLPRSTPVQLGTSNQCMQRTEISQDQIHKCYTQCKSREKGSEREEGARRVVEGRRRRLLGDIASMGGGVHWIGVVMAIEARHCNADGHGDSAQRVLVTL